MPEALTLILPKLAVLVFVVALGASIGSLLNVLVYRLPRGIGVVAPSSRCPSCGTKLTWRENIPVLGWVLLRGKCRFCGERISPEYPLVEAFVGFLFGAFYTLWYIVPRDAELLGIPIGMVAPEWAHNGPATTWVFFVVLMTLMSSLVAMTIIDARTYTIPLVLTWVPAAVALVLYTTHAVWFDLSTSTPVAVREGLWSVPGLDARWRSAPGWFWAIPTPSSHGWSLVGLALGGSVGLAISNALLALGAVKRSFWDYDAWLETHRAQNAALGEDDQGEVTEPGAHEWIQYPYARREMVRELAFVAPSVLLGIGGALLVPVLVARVWGPWTYDTGAMGMVPPVDVPVWARVVSGVLLGYLIGGGVVWGVRILGSIAFNKEAMGLGDVHMMAAVGACVGWIDATVAFFLAAFVAIGIVIVGALARSKVARAMPYGPSLAVATMIVLLAKPLVERGLGFVLALPGPLPLP